MLLLQELQADPHSQTPCPSFSLAADEREGKVDLDPDRIESVKQTKPGAQIW